MLRFQDTFNNAMLLRRLLSDTPTAEMDRLLRIQFSE